MGFDPEDGSKGGNSTCPFCGTVADSSYVKEEGTARRMGLQMMAVACSRPGAKGKVYLSADQYPQYVPNDALIQIRTESICARYGITVPDERIVNDAKNANFCVLYGLTSFRDLFTHRQTLSLLSFAGSIKESEKEMLLAGISGPEIEALSTYLAVMVDKLADYSSSLCHFNYTGGRGSTNTFGRQALGMTWDFSETYPFNPAGASWIAITEDIPAVIDLLILKAEQTGTFRRHWTT